MNVKERQDRRTLTLAIAAIAAAPGVAFAATKEEQQAEVRKAAESALAAVYKAAPGARQAVAKSAGYAAFSNFGMKILRGRQRHGQGHRLQQQDQGRRPT